MRKLVVAIGSAALLLTACGGGQTAAAPSTTSSAPKESGTLTVLAAASGIPLQQDQGRLRVGHPGVTVKLTFDGSSTLVQQIANGAQADVFASADQANMDKVTKASLNDGTPQLFARNKLAIAVPPSNPKNIATFADLAKPGVVVVVCADAVPCGAAALKVEAATGVTISPASKETAVTGVLSKVESGDADAGLVYLTDVNSAGSKVKGVPFPEADKAINDYPITALRNAPQSALAKEFVEFVRGEQGRKELTAVGFQVP
ncbi:molybdate ABC transporter substrate-binding protein [Kutzneria sp. 744]|uniref:molybdate ABC transporter substrate-binding protein n=1 Tax=Kutzneria sp. (strain 744) TaxID=345341 RepID=UPI0003EEB0C4|nr:molybdate ABC transporter substrate-binding protein [Kutzneria sp. 744]EWM14319.1 molybdate ABC transporter periplasmic molybdate-binding protein [Kutzneria sp. 744]